MVVCDHCRSGIYRTDVDLELIGKVAAVAPIQSVVSLGACGRWKKKDFRVIGQIQLDHGSGPWNEWCLLLDETEHVWLAEAQGELLIFKRHDELNVPPAADLEPGKPMFLGNTYFVVAEVGEARVTAAAGELPEPVVPGETYPYADARGADDQIATLAYGSGQEGGAVYLGRPVTEDELGIDENTVQRVEAPRVATKRLACPQCASDIQLLDAEGTKRVVCASCGTMFDPTKRPFVSLGKAADLKKKPLLELGAKGRLRGEGMQAQAFMIRKLRAGGRVYSWHEYLLRTPDGQYRWLVQSDGHWSLTRNVNPADMHRRRGVIYRGRRFRHFTRGKPEVASVLGEVYWQVKVGDKVQSSDYVAPPLMLSQEKTDKEEVWSLGSYVTPEEMRAAFGQRVRLPSRSGVAPNQPNPYEGAMKRLWRIGGGLLAALLLVAVVFHVTLASQVVLTTQFAAHPGNPGAAGTTEAKRVVLSEEFDLLPRRANVQIKLTQSGNNVWVGVSGALVAIETGAVYPFTVEAERWSGAGWSEGSGKGSVFIGMVPSGRYAVRLESWAQRNRPGAIPCTLFVKSQVPSLVRPLLVGLLLLVPPLIVTLQSRRFEARRWAESDYA